jgi:hypothetical protein
MSIFNTVHQISNQIPDTAKVATAVSSSVLSLFGIPVQEWGYVLSGLVAIVILLEKSPIVIQRIKSLWRWMHVRRKKL